MIFKLRSIAVEMLIVSFFLLLQVNVSWATGSPPWRANLSTDEGRLSFQLSHHAKYPSYDSLYGSLHTVATNVLLNNTQELLNLRLIEPEVLTVKSSPIWQVTYDENEMNYVEDIEAVERVKELLKNEAQKLFPDGETVSIPKHLAPALQALKGSKRLTKAFLTLLPILDSHGINEYDLDQQREDQRHSAEPTELISLSRILAQIKFSSQNALDNAYSDGWNHHILPKLRILATDLNMPELMSRVNSINNQVITRQIQNNLKLVKKVDHLQLNDIRIEKVPPLVSLTRGQWGRDCSKKNVSYYSLLPGVSTYYVNQNSGTNSGPMGYIFVAEAEYNGQRLPYFITPNGNHEFTPATVRAAIIAIAKKLNISEFAVTNLAKNPSVMNTDAMKKAIQSFQGSPVVVNLGSAWGQLDLHVTKLEGFRFRNYYDADNLKNAKLVRLPRKTLVKNLSVVGTSSYQEVSVSKFSNEEIINLTNDALSKRYPKEITERAIAWTTSVSHEANELVNVFNESQEEIAQVVKAPKKTKGLLKLFRQAIDRLRGNSNTTPEVQTANTASVGLNEELRRLWGARVNNNGSTQTMYDQWRQRVSEGGTPMQRILPMQIVERHVGARDNINPLLIHLRGSAVPDFDFDESARARIQEVTDGLTFTLNPLSEENLARLHRNLEIKTFALRELPDYWEKEKKHKALTKNIESNLCIGLFTNAAAK